MCEIQWIKMHGETVKDDFCVFWEVATELLNIIVNELQVFKPLITEGE